MSKLATALSLVIFGAATICLQPALATSDLMRGMSAYASKDYKTARLYFQKALQFAPEDSLAHYYMANTLLKLKDPAGAKKEYQSGSDNAETDDVKENCSNAIQALQKNDKTQVVKAGPSLGTPGSAVGATAQNDLLKGAVDKNGLPTTHSAGAASAAATAAGGGAAGTGGITPAALPGTTDVAIPLTPLQKQAQAEKDLMKQQSEAAQKQLLENAQSHTRSIDNDVKRATDTTDWNARARSRAQAYLTDIKTQAEKQKTQVLNNAKSQATQTQKMQEERSKALDEVVNNLSDQMNSKVGSSGVHLKPEGTSIYIRNYGP